MPGYRDRCERVSRRAVYSPTVARTCPFLRVIVGLVQGLGDILGRRIAIASMTAVLFSSALPVTGALAQGFERPPLRSRAHSRHQAPARNYTIATPVGSDGFMRIYIGEDVLLGDFTVIGDALMRTRQVELAALAELESRQQFRSVQQVAGRAGAEPDQDTPAISSPIPARPSATPSPASARCSARSAPA